MPGRLAAMDVGVTSPEASGAGEDCCDAMWRSKHRKYDAYHDELEEQGISYAPLVLSAFGRAHPEAESVLHTLAVRAARRRGLRDHRLILRRARVAIGVAIWRRAAAMVHACLPKLAAEEEALLFGCDPANAVEGEDAACGLVAADGAAALVE